ncbi:hypothetical protein OOZ19_04200 [Saccharopolyspora sp. NFXS83]|uniref:hypothetical protein n=1 Tax=Saccharopolyspora sp. NFXS83 TaxID=2993560 RepID=UPI00224B0E38|nr:hypothetical protein [Saccharopolyspora sp. NFXS83]MCX2729430.1 hypothetical protein [Saccharopolyspora sp. NFXS83]
MNDVLLGSVREDYQFLFSCTVFWLSCGNGPGLPHAKPGASAADAILDEVMRVTATVRPDDVSRAQYQVMSVLGVPRIDRTGRAQAWADHISLTAAAVESAAAVGDLEAGDIRAVGQ